MAPQARNWFGDDLRDAFGAEEVVECAGGLGDLADVGEPRLVLSILTGGSGREKTNI